MPSSIIPTLKYEDAATAIEWLCKIFGFEKHLVAADENGFIRHAQLTLGDDMIMLGSAGDSAFDRLQKPPAAVGGAVTQSPYIIIDDVDSHCDKARDAGAEIVMEPEDQPHGGRFYACKDPQGHLWNFGTYNPWLAQ